MVGTWLWDKDKIPGNGSWFHIVSLIICIICSFLIVYFLSSKHDKKLEQLITRIAAIVFVLIEITYQIMAIVYNGTFKFKTLPFNICSLPIFTTAISSFIVEEKHPKAKKIIDSFSVLICLMGGISMMILPGYTLSSPYVLRSIHTMLWHTLLVVYGFYMFFSKELYKEFKLKDAIPIICAATGIVLLGAFLSEIVYHCYMAPNHIDSSVDSANYYFSSKHYDTPIPVLSSIQHKIPYLVFLLLFIIFFVGVAILLKFLSHLTYSLINKYIISKRKPSKKHK